MGLGLGPKKEKTAIIYLKPGRQKGYLIQSAWLEIVDVRGPSRLRRLDGTEERGEGQFPRSSNDWETQAPHWGEGLPDAGVDGPPVPTQRVNPRAPKRVFDSWHRQGIESIHPTPEGCRAEMGMEPLRIEPRPATRLDEDLHYLFLFRY